MKYGFFGGSFDPPHYGHLLTATYAISALSLDKLFAVPTYHHPIKGPAIALVEQRAQMLRILFKNIKNCYIDDTIEKSVFIEQNNNNPVYTIDVVEKLIGLTVDIEKIKNPFYKVEHQWFLILGSDEYGTLKKWHRSKELLKIITPMKIRRGRASSDSLITIPNISSSKIRKHIFKNGGLKYLYNTMPPETIDYIQERNLYRSISPMRR